MIFIHTAVAFIAGLLFGAGLILSGMTDPLRIKAFLDIAGAWNPAMMVVMASAITVALPAFLWIKRSGHTLAGKPVFIANTRPVDMPLVSGAILFGIGWGLSGVCPGPGVMIAAAGSNGGLVFVLAMMIGMALHRRFGRTQAEVDDD